MIPFLIYLFESGMCLTLLFLVYFLFLRKETYFIFNRIYLLSILALSLLLPLLHFNFTMPQSEPLKQSVAEIERVKNYYAHLIALTDPEFDASFTKAFNANTSDEFNEGTPFTPSEKNNPSNFLEQEEIKNNTTGYRAKINWARLLLILYLAGMLFFGVRLLLLFRWLKQTIKKYGYTINNGVKLVKMDEEVPPFSFFRFVFVNRETASHQGFLQIMAHEEVHIRERHSIDLFFAHAITIIQWFNPFVWFINKAMKTNHEYIADRNVVDQGYELFDYQSLLLKQIISIRSVELVNNFNLINIKKRIAMMTKIKSGFAAQLKALVVIPAAILTFFFFAEISFAQTQSTGYKTIDITKEVQGFWKNENANDYGQLLNFKGTEIQILEDKENYRTVNFKTGSGTFGTTQESHKKNKFFEHVNSSKPISCFMTLPLEPGKSKFILLSLEKDKLIVGWTPDKVSVYQRTNAPSSLESFSYAINEDFEPISASYYRISENPERTFYLLMNKKGEIMFEGERIFLNDLQEKLDKVRENDNPFASDTKIAVLVIDAKCQMNHISKLFNKMRESDQLLHILSVKPFDQKVPEIFYHNVGIPRLLPPKDAQLMDEKEVEKRGMKIIRIDLTKGITPEKAASVFEYEIQQDKKFVVKFSYNNETTYKEYLSILDEFYQAIFSKRNALAQKKHNLNYDDMAKTQQKEIRKSYPMVLTERNIDQDE